MFGFNQSKKQDKNTSKIDKQSLLVALDATLNTDGQSTDEMIAATGKSRNEILAACMADDEVDACREDLESAIVAKAWRIYDDVANGQTGASSEDINRFYKIIRRHIKEFATLAVLAKFNGYAVAEYVYKVEEDGFLAIDQVLSKDGELDKYTPKRDGSMVFNGEQGETAIDQTAKCLVLKSRAVPSRPMGEMMIVKAYPAVLMRKKGWAYAGQFIARYAQPYVVAKSGLLSDLTDIANKVFVFLSGGAISINQDDDITLHQLSGDGSAFELVERLCNRRIQKQLLGRVKTSELSNGSRSAQETDDETRQDRIKGYLDLMTTAVQHAIDAMLLVNGLYGKQVHAPNGLWFEYLEQNKVDKARAERDKLYCDTGQIRLTKEYMIDMAGFEEHHFVMNDVQNIPINQNMPLSLQLSDTHTKHDNHNDDELLNTQQSQISQIKMDALLSVLNACDDYQEFEQKLEKLTLPDGGMMGELIKANINAYMGAINGKKNKAGEMGV